MQAWQGSDPCHAGQVSAASYIHIRRLRPKRGIPRASAGNISSRDPLLARPEVSVCACRDRATPQAVDMSSRARAPPALLGATCPNLLTRGVAWAKAKNVHLVTLKAVARLSPPSSSSRGSQRRRPLTAARRPMRRTSFLRRRTWARLAPMASGSFPR